MTNTSIQTYSGLYFDVLDPQESLVRLEDIAHSLSNTCRFNGHCRNFYCVAQHSILVAFLLSYDMNVNDPNILLAAMLHDAHEAYLGDMVRPIKESAYLTEDGIDGWCPWRELEANIQRVIDSSFGVDRTEEAVELIKHADNMALAIEARDLVTGSPRWPGLPEPIPTLFITDEGSETPRKVFIETVTELQEQNHASTAAI